MTSFELESRIGAWANRCNDVAALVLGGSRAKIAAGSSSSSDWDYQLICKNPNRLMNAKWLPNIAPVWVAYGYVTPRGVYKLSVVFEGGLEVDFVLLKEWQMRLVFWSMRYEKHSSFMPPNLINGIHETRGFLCGSGYKVLKGGILWEDRIASGLEVKWNPPRISFFSFEAHCESFWQKTFWICKKVIVPELRSAVHWLHLVVLTDTYTVLAEEARIEGRVPRPEARKAEAWLSPRRLEQTVFETRADQQTLARALLSQIKLFEEVSEFVATSRGFSLPDRRPLADWIRAQLTPLANGTKTSSPPPETRL